MGGGGAEIFSRIFSGQEFVGNSFYSYLFTRGIWPRYAPCYTRTRLFRLINTHNGALRALPNGEINDISGKSAEKSSLGKNPRTSRAHKRHTQRRKAFAYVSIIIELIFFISLALLSTC